MRKFVLAGVVMLFLSSVCWSQELNYASYTQSTLQHIIAAEEQIHPYNQAEVNKQADCIRLECSVSKYRVSCCYSNIRRPISEKKKNVIKMWLEALKIDPRLASLYQQEIQVTEGTRVHWIPIQEQLFPRINPELVKNDTIGLFIIFISKVESEYVFIATEFEKSISPDKNMSQATAGTHGAR